MSRYKQQFLTSKITTATRNCTGGEESVLIFIPVLFTGSFPSAVHTSPEAAMKPHPWDYSCS